jgi:hypothetical protein
MKDGDDVRQAESMEGKVDTHHPPGPCGDVPSGLQRATAA